MNMTTKKMELNTVNSLVLCHLASTAPNTTVLNRSASARAAAAAGAASNAARTYNTVINSKGTPIGRGISLQHQVAVNIRRLGLPCPMGGIYLRVRDVERAQNIFDDGMAELDVIREDILACYPMLLREVTIRLGSFINEVAIPTATEVASRFTMRMTIIAQPTALDNNVLSGLTDEVANRVRADSQRQIDDMLRAAHAGPIRDLKRVLEEFIDRVSNAERLHLTQFDKLREEAIRLNDLNVLKIPEIDDLISELAGVCVPPVGIPNNTERAGYAKRASVVMTKAESTLSALGL